MQQSSPRIPPVAPEAFTPEQKSLVGDWTALNFSRVIVENPGLYRTLIPLIGQLISGSALPPRDREVLILRTLRLSDEVYEYNHHVLIARKAGMTEAEIEAASAGQPDLSPFDQALVRAADELVRDQCVSDPTWRTLAERYSKPQLMEVVALVGLYALMAMLTKSFGIELEDSETFSAFGQLRKYT
jgi:alkylhydroperoxidase family enzyme